MVCRHWDVGVGRGVDCTAATNVRVVSDRLSISWNDELCRPPTPTRKQIRTVSAWGERQQADLVRQRILVVGTGSVGLDVVLRLMASGHCDVTVMDFDVVELHNLDRLIGAESRDVRLKRSKIHVARREGRAASRHNMHHSLYRISQYASLMVYRWRSITISSFAASTGPGHGRFLIL